MSPEDPGIRVHRRQYVVGPDDHPMADDWVVAELGHGLRLSHCPELLVNRATDGDGTPWVLLGLATQTVAGRPDPVDQIAVTPTAGIRDAYESWAGRWTLIGSGRVHLDATGQLGCHWTTDPDGGTWAASSPAAIRIIVDGPARPLDLVYERGISWVAPPLGLRPGVRRLLPSEILDLESGTTTPRRLVTPRAHLGPDPTDDELMARFGAALGQAMARLPSNLPRHLALTAGADSRMVLAAAVSADVELELFTRRAARMSVADRVLPPRLAAAVGLGHCELVAPPADHARWPMVEVHSDHHVSVGDAIPFLEGVRDGMVGVEIGGQGFGAGKVKNRHFPASIQPAERTATRIADFFGEPPRSSNRQALAAWLTVVDRQNEILPPPERVDWRDRFYLEQRTGGWQSAKEQVYDMHRHHRFPPINCARTLGLLLAVSEERRADGSHRAQLIGMMDKRLLALPFNPPGSSFGPARRLSHLLTVDRGGAARRSLRRVWSRAAPGT